MSEREKRNWRFSLNLYFSIINFAIYIVVVIVSTVVLSVLQYSFHFSMEIPEIIYVLLLCAIMGSVITMFLYRRVLLPINKLSQAMENVSAGRFDIALKTESFIDEVQKLYHNFNLMVQKLAMTETLQTDFVSNVSHEFKTPINAIEGYATLLRGEPDLSPTQAEYTEKILYNTRRLSDLVHDILLLSKIDNQAIISKQEIYRLDEQIRQAIVYLEPKWSEKQIDLAAELETVHFKGNQSLLMHVWLNLIDNAIKYNPIGGSVRICLKTSEQNVLVSVQDSGCGISDTEKERIFEKFYQSDTSHKDEGYGLGLALAKQIILIHHGYIDVDSGAAKGSKFTVVLPIEWQPDE